ncbi:MAG: circularly permuted type 2 ATP-grasp protein [Caulobacter sp.]|nr:circularly permuted type 2 ATP-grasp protein [Vitreoscilla sp.]
MPTSVQTSFLPDDAPEARALARAAALRGTPGSFDELHGLIAEAAAAGHALAPAWQAFFDAAGSDGWVDLAQTKARIQRKVQDDGVTYNVYAEGTAAANAWPLEPLPFLIDAAAWAIIEKGVTQRARLLDAVLADVYGGRSLLDEGLLPASLVLAHPQYLRAMHGCRPAGGVHLHVAAFDLARGPDGQWRVVSQRTQAPSGMGYLLQNRLIISQQFPAAFRDLHVQRVAAGFLALLQGLQRLSPEGDNARVVLLTPGPHNETYFEHAFLSRYLGITLVEGGDLTVRGERLFLKTLHGLEPVHVLLRRVDDEYLDPLELRGDSALGVPGLLGVIRAGQVVVANAPGAGFLESPGLAAFWPKISRRLLGEELLLPSTTSWWCGEDSVWETQRERLAQFVVAPTFPTSDTTEGFAPHGVAELSPDARKALLADIDARPAAYTLQARVRPSEIPVWNDNALEPRAALVRVFATSDGRGGWQVMPGALTRVATRRDAAQDAWLSMQHGSVSVDTWVLTDGQVDPTTLLPRPLSAADLSRTRRTVTSRSAENLYWLGRYTERADNSVRLARITLESLNNANPVMLDALGRLALRNGLIGGGVPLPTQSVRVFERSLVHTMADPSAMSVAYNLRALRSCAQALRERLSVEHWKLIDAVGRNFEERFAVILQPRVAGSGSGVAVPAVESVSDVQVLLQRAATHLAAITGAQSDRMTRDDGWRLLSVGPQTGRLDFLTQALMLGLQLDLPARDDGFALLLGLFDSTITYRAQFQARRELPPLLQLLVLELDNPRSLAGVARTLRDRVTRLARHEARWVQRVLDELPAPDEWSLEALCEPDEEGRHAMLLTSLKTLSERTQALSAEVGRRLFSHVGPGDHTVWQ